MIAKGAARNNPRQLAVYLMRVERYATGEPVALLEFQSAWAKGLNFEKGPDDVWRISSPLVLQQTAAKLIEGFRDWQVLTEGTNQGRDGLYHAEISPAPEYADTMTPKQWKRAADILGEELGLQDQPRAIVLHGGTDGRKHMHVVWARTDVDQMKIISDSYNFAANEKASHRMELEFGHAFVPGKHHKRDREKQPEFPRQEYSQAEAQQASRTEMTVPERKAQLTALHATSNGGAAFKAALENAGYVLAQGERGYMAVDQAGEFYSLARYIKGMKIARLEEFMAGVELDKLPTIEQAKALQKEANEQEQKQKSPPPPEAQEPAPEASPAELRGAESSSAQDQEALQPQPPQPSEKAPEPAPAPEKAAPVPIDLTLYATKSKASKFLSPELAQKIEPPAPAPVQVPPGPKPIDLTLYTPQPKAEEVPPSQPTQVPQPQPAPQDVELEALKKAIVERQAQDARKWADDNAIALQRLERDLTVMNAGKTKDFEAMLAGEMRALTGRQKQNRGGLQGIRDAIQSKLNPTQAAEKAEEQRREVEQLKTRQVRERKDYLALIAQTKQLEIENLKERQALQRSDRERMNEEETEQYIREYHEAKRIRAEFDAQGSEEELEHNDSLREGPPPPRLGK